MKVFEKLYDGESLVDLDRDLTEAIIDDFNPTMCSIPRDENRFPVGRFKVSIEWSEE